VLRFRYLEMIATDQNYVQEEIMSLLNSGNACCYLDQNRLPSRLLSRIVKIKIYKKYNFIHYFVWV
jgi:hypothetical protein